MSPEPTTVLEVANLRTTFTVDEGLLQAVDDISFELAAGRTLGLVGESGCGKSMTAYSILRLTPRHASIEGSIVLHREEQSGGDVDLARLDPFGPAIRAIRGNDVAIVFQEPMTSLSPVHTIGNQLMEPILLHRTSNRREAREIAIDILDRVGIANPGRRIDEYPQQFSGGMRQRVMIAIALSCNPSVLIADEPTTALDVTIQAQVLDLLSELQESLGMAMLYITHDLGVIAEVAHDVAVMYLGKIVEITSVDRLFAEPLHPYTQGLLRSIPTLGAKSHTRLESIPGSVPAPINLPRGCAFFRRCPAAMPGICDRVDPPLVEVSPEHRVRCFLYPQVRAAAGAPPDRAVTTREWATPTAHAPREASR